MVSPFKKITGHFHFQAPGGDSQRRDLSKPIKPRHWLYAVALVFFCMDGNAVQAQGVKIGTIVMNRVLTESTYAKGLQLKLDADFESRNNDLKTRADNITSLSNALDKNDSSLSSSDRVQKQLELSRLESDFQRRKREFDEDYEQRRAENLAAIDDRAKKAITRIAEEQHYDLVVEEGVYKSPRTDITDQIIKDMSGPGQ